MHPIYGTTLALLFSKIKGDNMKQTSIKYGILLTMFIFRVGKASIADFHQANSDSFSTEYIIVDSIHHPRCEELKVYFFRSKNVTTPCPTIYFCHGIGATHPEYYDILIDYIVSHNVNVCYSTCQPVKAAVFPRDAYTQLWRGFVAGHRKWEDFIDDKQVGFVGHSYGGGAAVHMAWRAVHKRNWGSKGCFVYTMAPWYCHKMNKKRFGDFPSHTILVTQVYEDDHTNDYRMAQDIFNSFLMPDDRKCFITVFSAKKDSINVPAGHSVPVVEDENRYLGRHVVYPVIDSLLFYAFNEPFEEQIGRVRRRGQLRKTGESDGWECTFLKGSKCAFKRSQRKYLNFWGHAMNPRIKGSRLMPVPVRLCIRTPQTVMRYCAFGVSKVLERMNTVSEN